jgi:hypothetical protein
MTSGKDLLVAFLSHRNTPLHIHRVLQEVGRKCQKELLRKMAEKRDIWEDLGPSNDMVAPFRADGKTFCGEMLQPCKFIRETPAKKIA